MSNLRLHLHSSQQPDLPVPLGRLSLASYSGTLTPVEPNAPWQVQFNNDRRGIWMALADGTAHVNGRPIQKLAMLRAGDHIHIGEHHLLLRAPVSERASNAATSPDDILPRMLLRGVGGTYHGRGISLPQTCTIGSTENATLHITGDEVAEHHATIRIINGQVVLKAAAPVLVNGFPVSEAVLRPDDQIVFSRLHRFVLEGTIAQAPASAPAPSPQAPAAAANAKPRGLGAQRASLLLITALLLAIALALLLVYGPH